MSPPRRTAAQWLQDSRPIIGSNPETALAYIENAIALEPKNPQGWFYKASVHHHAGRPADALAAFQRTAELDGGTAPAVNGVVVCLKRLRRFDEASAAYHSCRDRTHFVLEAGYADLQKDLGDVPKALEFLLASEPLAKSDSDRSLYWYNRACYEALLSRRTDALTSLTKAIALSPKYKQSASRDPDFAAMWSEPAFRSLTA